MGALEDAKYQEQLKSDRKLVERVDKFGKGLTDEEISLVETCKRFVDEGRILTAKQRPWLEDIDDKRVGN